MAVDEPVAELPQGLALLRTLRAAAGNINEIAWSPDGRELASGDPDGRIGVWDIASGEQRLRLERGERLVWSIAWSPSGDRLASGTNEGSITIYQTATGESLETLGNHASWVRSVAWSPQGNLIASGANDKKVMVWDLESGECRQVFEGHRDRVLGVRFSPDGSLVASAGGDGDVVVWHLANREPIARHHFKAGWQRSVCFSPDGRVVAAGGEDGAVRILRIADSRLAAVLEGHREGVGCVAFDASGQVLASRSVDGRIRLWSPSRGTWRLLARIKTAASFPMANLAFHPSEPTLAAVDQNRIRLWQIQVDTLRHAADGLPTAPIRTAKWLLTGHGTAEILDALQAQACEIPLALEPAKVSLLDKNPPRRPPTLPSLYRLADPPSRKHEQRELILWDLGMLDESDLDPELFAFDIAGLLVGLGPDGDATAQLGAVGAKFGRLSAGKTPPLLGILARGLKAPQLDLSSCGPPVFGPKPTLPLAALLPAAWLARCRDGLFELTDDESLVAIGSAATLLEIEKLLDDDLAEGRFVSTLDDLFRQWLGRDGQPLPDETKRRQLDVALRQLELRGHLRRLRPGPLVAARGITESYAAAFFALAAKDERALGGISELLALDGPLDLPDKLRLEGQLDDLLRLGVLRELGEIGLAFRAPLAGVPHYFFPRHFGKDRPPMREPSAATILAEQEVEGDLALALAALAIRLADGHAFHQGPIHANGAIFSSPLGGEFSVMLKVSEVRQTETMGRLVLSGDGPPDVGRLFAQTALSELDKLADAFGPKPTRFRVKRAA